MSEDSFSFLRSFNLVLAGQDVRILRLPVPNALSGQISLISIFFKKNLKYTQIKKHGLCPQGLGFKWEGMK